MKIVAPLGDKRRGFLQKTLTWCHVWLCLWTQCVVPFIFFSFKLNKGTNVSIAWFPLLLSISPSAIRCIMIPPLLLIHSDKKRNKCKNITVCIIFNFINVYEYEESYSSKWNLNVLSLLTCYHQIMNHINSNEEGKDKGGGCCCCCQITDSLSPNKELVNRFESKVEIRQQVMCCY